MEEAKVQNIQDSMKYYCRVCTTNTRSKKSKPDDCIMILRRSGLKSILEKYLHLQFQKTQSYKFISRGLCHHGSLSSRIVFNKVGRIVVDGTLSQYNVYNVVCRLQAGFQLKQRLGELISEDDPLPKVICKTCYEKVEAVEFLRVIARRTEALLRDFLKNQNSKTASYKHFQNEYNSFAMTKNSALLPSNENEVIVNVSLSDPLTKDINKKLLVAQRKNESFDIAFSPTQISHGAITSTPNATPLTVVHQMPKKKLPVIPHLQEKRQKLQMALSNATTVTLENPPVLSLAAQIKLPTRPKTSQPPPPLRHISEAPSIPQKVEIHPVVSDNSHALGRGVTLGSIIKDEDLLRLILKALKWPVNNQTLGIQIQRLKNTNFSDVIVNPNLLQDTDLIQILGPLIHPTLVPVQLTPQPQPHYIAIPPDPMAPPSSTISYKLPAETSVQIITVPLEEKPKQVKPLRPPPSGNVIRRRRRPQVIGRPISNAVIVVSDDSGDELLKDPNDDIQRFEVQLDPAIYPGIGENSNSNETMLATLNRQREAMMRMHRSKRKQNLVPSNVEMVDDIMIVDEGVQMNEYPEVVLVKKPRKPNTTPTATASCQTVKNTTHAVELLQKSLEPQSAPKAGPSTLPKLGVQPSQLITLLTKKPLSSENVIETKLPSNKEVVSFLKPILNNVAKITTLADADSTTKIIIKESKVTKLQKPSLDIEDHITKVRIGKQIQNPATTQDSAKGKNSPGEREVLVVVEYEEEDGSRKKREEQNDKHEKHEAEKIEEKNREENVTTESVAEKADDTAIIEESQENESSEASAPVQLESIEIKSEDTEAAAVSKDPEPEDSVKEDAIIKADEEKETTESTSSKSTQKSSGVSKRGRPTRLSQKRKAQEKPEVAKPVVANSAHFRPARRSKTLSKYYKGPPISGATGRLMRSRT